VHLENPFNTSYSFPSLCKAYTPLTNFILKTDKQTDTIDFSNSDAVYALNKALLLDVCDLNDWTIPKGYLCPPIPSRADYLFYIKDLIRTTNTTSTISGIDIGVGANCVFPLIAASLLGWHITGIDSSPEAIHWANKNLEKNAHLTKYITLIQQNNPANLFPDLTQSQQKFDFSMCNPPFYKSAKEAALHNQKKNKNLNIKASDSRNFGGQSNELWCNGGEALFLKRMIKQSQAYKENINWFTSLVSSKDNLPKLVKLIHKLGATSKIIPMTHGNKKTRILAWSFRN